jgi:hypothetical protein
MSADLRYPEFVALGHSRSKKVAYPPSIFAVRATNAKASRFRLNRFSKCELVHSFEPLTRVIRHNKILQATAMSAEEEYYRKGDRVRLSELGRQRMSRNRATTAVVVGYGRSETTIRIVFDGSSYPVSIHASYLERDRPRDAPPRDRGGSSSLM